MSAATIKIDKDIPPPAYHRAKYPFPEMEVGDSFAVGAEDRNRVSSAAVGWAADHGGTFSVRKYGDAYRCWRVA